MTSWPHRIPDRCLTEGPLPVGSKAVMEVWCHRAVPIHARSLDRATTVSVVRQYLQLQAHPQIFHNDRRYNLGLSHQYWVYVSSLSDAAQKPVDLALCFFSQYPCISEASSFISTCGGLTAHVVASGICIGPDNQPRPIRTASHSKSLTLHALDGFVTLSSPSPDCYAPSPACA